MSLSRRDKTYTLIGILLALFLGALDQTIVATALPKIVRDLNGVSRYAWVATSYMLASTALVPIYGRLADSYSRRKIELWAIGLFLSGSVLCGLAGEFGPLPLLGDGMSQLIWFRALQGLGGAGLIGMAFIIIADLFSPAERGKYQGLVGAAFGLASVLGPLIGGFLTDNAGGIIPGVEGWRWVFYVNVPFGALALWFIITRMPPLKPVGDGAKLNYLSAFLLITGLVPLILALQLDKSNPRFAWDAPLTLGFFALAAVCLILFSLRSLRVKNPILDFGLFKNRVFSVSNLAVFLLGAGFFSIVIFLPLFMVTVVGVSATESGASLIPLSLGIVFGSIVSGQLVSRFGHYRLWMLSGGVILMLGVLLLSLMTASIGYWQVTAYMVLCGLGLGPILPLYTLAIQNAVDVRKLGQATSASQFFRQIGGTIGVAIMGTVLATTLAASLAANSQLAALGAAPELEGGAASSSPAQIEAGIEASFAQQYQQLAAAIQGGDEAALQSVLEASSLPEAAQTGILQGVAAAESQGPQAVSGFLEQLQGRFEQQANDVAQTVIGATRQAFTTAITKIYRYALFIIIAGWLMTFFVPEVPLRKTLDHPIAAAAD